MTEPLPKFTDPSITDPFDGTTDEYHHFYYRYYENDSFFKTIDAAFWFETEPVLVVKSNRKLYSNNAGVLNRYVFDQNKMRYNRSFALGNYDNKTLRLVDYDKNTKQNKGFEYYELKLGGEKLRFKVFGTLDIIGNQKMNQMLQLVSLKKNKNGALVIFNEETKKIYSVSKRKTNP